MYSVRLWHTDADMNPTHSKLFDSVVVANGYAYSSATVFYDSVRHMGSSSSRWITRHAWRSTVFNMDLRGMCRKKQTRTPCGFISLPSQHVP